MRVVNTDNNRIHGTGSAVAPNKILTSAHVAENLKTNANGRMVVYPGEHDGYRPMPVEVTRVDTHPKYVSTGNQKSYNDVAVLTVNYNFNEYFRVTEVTNKNITYASNFAWIGYPVDKNIWFNPGPPDFLHW